MTAILDNENLVRALAWTLLHTLWQGVAIALLLAIVLRAMRGATSTVRYLAACAALAILLLSAIVTFALLAKASRPAPIAGAELLPQRIAAAPRAEWIVTPSHAIAQHHPDPLRHVVTIWLGGVAAMAAWHAGGWLLLMRLRRGRPVTRFGDVLDRLATAIGVTRAVRLLEAARVDVPAVVGMLRPVILLPVALLNDLSPQQIEAILAHELAHVRRHDYFVNLIQSAVETLMFYHPATWWISTTIRRERENCCDDIAANICGDDRAYAGALAALEARRPSRIAPRLAPAASGGDLLDRVRRVLKLPPLRRRASRTRSLAAAALALACVVLPLVVTAHDKPVPATERMPDAVRAAAAEASPVTPADLEPRDEPVRIAPNDLLVVSISDLVAPGVETVKTARVGEGGTYALPRAGTVAVAGLTEEEARRAVVKALADANVLPDASVRVKVNESRARAFDIFGVPQAGRYVIPRPDFRVLDALAMAKAELKDMATLRIIRGGGATERVISIPPARLAAGDASVNAVIRGGDVLITTPHLKRYVKVAVAQDGLRLDGKPTDVAALDKLLGARGEVERRNTVLQVAAASPDVTVERFFSATAALHQLVDRHKLAYLSQTGIDTPRTPATAPGTVPASPKTDGAASQRAERSSTRPAVARAAGEPSSSLEALLQQREKLVARIDGLGGSLGSEHPAIKDARAQLQQVERRIHAEREWRKGVGAAMSIQEIAAVDATMREYLSALEALEFNLARLSRNLGPKNRYYLDSQQDLDLLKQRINTYAESFRRTFTGETIIDPQSGQRVPLTREMQAQLREREPSPATQP